MIILRTPTNQANHVALSMDNRTQFSVDLFIWRDHPNPFWSPVTNHIRSRGNIVWHINYLDSMFKTKLGTTVCIFDSNRSPESVYRYTSCADYNLKLVRSEYFNPDNTRSSGEIGDPTAIWNQFALQRQPSCHKGHVIIAQQWLNPHRRGLLYFLNGTRLRLPSGDGRI